MSGVTVGKNGRVYARAFDWEDAADRYRAGATIEQIAESIGVTPRAVHRALILLGVPRRRQGVAAGPIPHGTATGYWRGCRCDECRVAANARRNEHRRNRPNVAIHGRYGYGSGCRCDVCRADHAVYSREKRARAKASA